MNLQLLRNNKKVEQVVYGREYTLRADITHPDGKNYLLIFFSISLSLYLRFHQKFKFNVSNSTENTNFFTGRQSLGKINKQKANQTVCVKIRVCSGLEIQI